MMNSDEIQVAPGSCSLARQQYSNKRGEWFYNLRQSKRPQRQGGPGRLMRRLADLQDSPLPKDATEAD